MEDAALVGVVDRPADRDEQPGRVQRRHRPVRQLPGQGRPLDVLHREERLAVALADLEDRDDVGMGQPCRGLRLEAEPLDVLGGRLGPAEQPLERHDPPARDLPGPRDHAHPAPAELLEQLVVAEPAAGRGRRGRHGPDRRRQGPSARSSVGPTRA